MAVKKSLWINNRVELLLPVKPLKGQVQGWESWRSKVVNIVVLWAPASVSQSTQPLYWSNGGLGGFYLEQQEAVN